MIETMFLFRSNLRIYESYAFCKTLKEFKNKCWDFYINMGIWALENDRMHEFIVWRLEPIYKSETTCIAIKPGIILNQKFVDSFNNVKKYCDSYPSISFWRGGFKEYDEALLHDQKLRSATNLYCGSGRRIYPKCRAQYDSILLEDEKDFNPGYNYIPFYKTANPNIFHNMNIKDKKYDICFPCNFSSIRYKGQLLFIQEISKSKFLRSLKIVHIGNKSNVGKKLCKRYKVTNIKFLDHLDRPGVNKILNQSKFAIVCSNRQDGCPRIISEVLCSGTPLLLRNTTRLLPYYKKHGVQTFSDNNISEKIEKGFVNYKTLKEDLNDNIKRLSMDTICTKNFDVWERKMDSYK